MLEAYERIAEEKKLGDKGKQVGGEIRDLLNQAQKYFDKCHQAEANAAKGDFKAGIGQLE